jgi:hypothetical protein
VSLTEFGRRLRTGKPPVIGYIADQRHKIDLATVFARQDGELSGAVRDALE